MPKSSLEFERPWREHQIRWVESQIRYLNGQADMLKQELCNLERESKALDSDLRGVAAETTHWNKMLLDLLRLGWEEDPDYMKIRMGGRVV